MKAIIKESATPGLTLKSTLDIPVPGRGEVLVRVKAASICGTDLHIYQWDNWAAGAGIKIPGVSGHECVAEVVQLGEGVQTVAVGDRISVETHIPCGRCHLCENGKPHICENLRLFGLHTDGCFAEYSIVPEIILRKIPDSIPDEIAAILEPLGVGVHAAQKSDVEGKNVAVLGAGPIGVFSACASLALGARTVRISDLKNSRLEIARACGDMSTWNPLETTASTVFGSNVPDVIIETTGSERSLREALPYLRKGGNITLVGLFREEVPINLSRDIVFKEATVKGIHGRMMWDTWDLMESLLLQNKLNVAPAVTHRLSLGEFSEGFRVALNGEAMKVLLYP